MARVRVNERELRKLLQGIARQFEEADRSFRRRTRGCPSTWTALTSPTRCRTASSSQRRTSTSTRRGVAGDEPFELHLTRVARRACWNACCVSSYPSSPAIAVVIAMPSFVTIPRTVVRNAAWPTPPSARSSCDVRGELDARLLVLDVVKPA